MTITQIKKPRYQNLVIYIYHSPKMTTEEIAKHMQTATLHGFW